MADRMNSLKFEHPLNEQTRFYLRIEFLLQQVKSSSTFSEDFQYQIFFHSLFDLLDIFEQVQLKTELAKDLEKQKIKFKGWLDVPDVNQDTLRSLLDDIDTCRHHLMTPERLGKCLREDKFLSAIKQRFTIPGGSCCFDLPALHYWLKLPKERQMEDVVNWVKQLSMIMEPLNLCLKLIRESSLFQDKVATKGFFQSDMDEANLLRLDIPMDSGVYPMISGHKNRFALRFLSFESNQNCDKDIEFKLAVC